MDHGPLGTTTIYDGRYGASFTHVVNSVPRSASRDIGRGTMSPPGGSRTGATSATGGMASALTASRLFDPFAASH